MKKHIYIAIFTAFSPLLLRGQNGNILHCGFPTDSISLKKMEQFDMDLRKNANNIFPRSTIIIPVVVHIVKTASDEVISDEAVFSQIDKDVAYLVYPNPTTSGQININLKIGNNTEGGTIRLFNYQGQLIIQRPVLANINDLTLDLLGISNGLYLLSIAIAHKDIHIQKVVILN